MDKIKFDKGKRDLTYLWEYFPRALAAVVAPSEYGFKKYGKRGGWKLGEPADSIRRYTAAMGRHLLAETTEGKYGKADGGLSHASQVAWNALARLELMLENGLLEDRDGVTVQEHVAKIANRAPPACPDLDQEYPINT